MGEWKQVQKVPHRGIEWRVEVKASDLRVVSSSALSGPRPPQIIILNASV